ncbi:MAG TPA: DNA-processing protein DprA, partial [Candidatus Goldiibacteriota bacterium]|nr:DNA-processing protein DprA [Candidatus Goldiibacteriota bacterium]
MGKFCTEKDALIAINTIPAIGGIKLRRLINVFGSCLDIFDASPEMLTAVEGIGVETAKDILALTPEITEREEEACQKNSVRIICSDDIEYPKQLKTIYDPPPVLYMAGADYRETALPLAIVGTRQCTEYGDAAVRRVVQRMRAIFSDFSVISGLATGIDSRAHRAALNSGIYTAGVLGFGFGQLLTMINRPLIKEMLEKAT